MPLRHPVARWAQAEPHRTAGGRQPLFARVRVAKPNDYTGSAPVAGSLASAGPVKGTSNQGFATGGRPAGRPPRRPFVPAPLILLRMIRKFWLLFAQACTLCIAAL